jgi:hypothetical protein
MFLPGMVWWAAQGSAPPPASHVAQVRPILSHLHGSIVLYNSIPWQKSVSLYVTTRARKTHCPTDILQDIFVSNTLMNTYIIMN